jgi:hypothetical protein
MVGDLVYSPTLDRAVNRSFCLETVNFLYKCRVTIYFIIYTKVNGFRKKKIDKKDHIDRQRYQ